MKWTDIIQRAVLGWSVLALIISPGYAQTNPRFELKENDRVVMVGDTLMEREGLYGHLEYMLTVQTPNRKVTFRNLGWSADLPNGRSRVSFDWHKPPGDWFRNLLGQINDAQPTVLIVGYGMAASLEDSFPPDAFRHWMTRLLEEVRAGHPEVRFLLLSPIRHERLPEPWPDPAAHNQRLARYVEVVREVAESAQARFVSLFEGVVPETPAAEGAAYTDNGIHLNEAGYRRLAEVVAQSLGWYPSFWQFGLMEDGQPRRGILGVQVQEVEKKEDRLEAVLQPGMVPMPPLDETFSQVRLATPPLRLQAKGLSQGEYGIVINGRRARVASGQDLARTEGVLLEDGPAFDQARKLLASIRRKNELFFHRWRPQNSTYLFLFRKHEQGQNAREIPMFDPLIENEESQIARLKVPNRIQLEIKPLSEAAQVQPTREINDPPSVASPAPVREKVEPLPLPEFQTDPEIEIKLWAENPLLAKPIQMNFDPRGRLWVVSSSVYPQIIPGQEANDKVLILEDTDGNGRADRSTVFADGLLIPTGVEPGDGGAYVGHSTELVHFADTDGDDRADERRVVYSGFGTEDTHHILHTLRWGFDGHLYMNQSIYIHSHVETPLGVSRLNSGGIWRVDPRDLGLEIFMKGLVNTWGHHYDGFGQSFATDGAGTPQAGLSGITYVVPGAMYHTYAGARRILGSISPGSYPKFAGLEHLLSPHFPDAWQGNLVTCDFRANRVVRFAVEEMDSAFVATEQPLFVRTKNVTFRPIDVKVGPDGALYIADWTNPIIQHGEVDFRDPRRDHVHGRIWRVTFKGRDLESVPDLAALSHRELLDHTLSSNGNTRKQARRLLTERGGAVVQSLATWSGRQTAERAKLEALWLHQALHSPEPELLKTLLEAEDGRVRAAAVRVLADWRGQVPDAQAWLAARVTDEHPRVRLETIRALSGIKNLRSMNLALSTLHQPMDEHLDYALWLTVNDLADPWLEEIKAGRWEIEGRGKGLDFVLNALEPARAGEVMNQLMAGRVLPEDGSGPWLDLVAKAGGRGELRQLLDQALRGGFNDIGLAKVLGALHQAARVRNIRPAGDLRGVSQWLEKTPREVRRQAILLAGSWKGPGESLERLVSLAGAPQTEASLRDAAFAALRDIGGGRVVQALLPLCQPGTEPPIRRQAVLVIAGLDLAQGVPQAINLLIDMEDESAALEFWRGLLRIRRASDDLARAMPKTGLPTVMAKTGLRAAREGGRNQASLILALSSGADLDEETKALSEAEMKQLATRAVVEGDPHRGEHVYRRMELACTTCHAIGGVGGKVGPDLTSIGASAPVDYLIESLLYPNRKIKEGYHTTVIETKDDEEYAGVLVRESSAELFLMNAANQETAIPKNNVAVRRTGNSLMPAGLVDALAYQDRLDLFRFLAELGKPGPFDATQGTVARAWRLSPGTIDLAQFGDEKILQSDLQGRDWMQAATTVDGRLLKDAFQTALAMKSWRGPQAVYAAARFEMSTPGKPTLELDAPPGAKVWLEGQPLSFQDSVAVGPDLSAGIKTVMVKIEADQMPEYIRLKVDRGTFQTE